MGAHVEVTEAGNMWRRAVTPSGRATRSTAGPPPREPIVLPLASLALRDIAGESRGKGVPILALLPPVRFRLCQIFLP